ncbi:MAG: (d)CMP kinase, partial [Planctomycetota bacterium]|nr:(d)CMP kinase [Planctomycetota bacterium]
AGKSTAARQLAQRLGFEFLDTGAMYRAVTWYCCRHKIDLGDPHAVADAARRMSLEFVDDRVRVDGEDVSLAIRTPEITRESRHVAGNNVVRQFLVELQRSLAAGRNVVTEGRDQGTVAFPHAECKFFLVADPRERALRRQRELEQRGQQVSLEELLQQQSHRDQRDAEREFGAMRAAEDAHVIDTSRCELEQVVAQLERMVRERFEG